MIILCSAFFLVYLICHGKLLFPIGTNPNWLLDGHDQITLELTGSTVTGNVDVSDIGFYKLDELPQSLISDPGGTEK